MIKKKLGQEAQKLAVKLNKKIKSKFGG